ncbi:MAG: hypothetical protein K6B75_08880 [Lachnospiraceae bacterium]|nr:hypothetical protein [Lachnospiraceae bacterium]
MKGKQFKEKIIHNIGLKLLSIVLAFILWVVVINQQDPVETVTIKDIPVSVINEGSLTNLGYSYKINEGATITIEVEARRSITSNISSANVVATADFSKVSITNSVPIDISVTGYSESDVEIVKGLNQVMILEVEKKK